MSLPMLAVDSNLEFHQRERKAWKKQGVPVVHATTMQGAIELLPNTTFHFVAINADSVNYIPLMKIMSDVSQIPILIGDSNFTHEKQVEAFANGAAWYAQLHDEPEINVKTALSFLESLRTREKLVKRIPKIITRGNLTLYADYNKVFCNDAEIILTPKEYRLLYYLLSNPNITLTFGKLARKVWEAETVASNAMWQIVYRLNAKLKEAGWSGGEIINFRGVGYRFSAQLDT